MPLVHGSLAEIESYFFPDYIHERFPFLRVVVLGAVSFGCRRCARETQDTQQAKTSEEKIMVKAA